MNPLQLRLASLRHRMILVNFWRGSCTLFAILMGILLIEGLSDWKVHLPAPLRGLILVGSLVVLGTAFVRYLYQPLTKRLDDLSLALRIEEIYPELNDNLASAVQFLDEPEENLQGSKVMRQHAIEHALKRADHCDFSNIIDRRGVLVRPLTALILGLLAAHFVYHHATFTSKALIRLVDPFGGHSWTQIEIEAPPERIAQGQSFTIKGQLTGIIPDKARLEMEGTLTQSDKVIYVKREADKFAGTFQTPLDMGPKAGKFRFRILANDGTYPAHGGWTAWIQVQAPPHLVPLDGILSPQIELEYPAYTDLRSPERLSPGPDPQVTAVFGTKIRWRAAVDRPVEKAWLEHAGGIVPCDIDATGTVLSVEFTPAITASATAKIHFKDTMGLGNYDKIDLNIFEDAIPLIQMRKPAWAVEKMLSDAQVTLEIAAKDELGKSGPAGAIRSVYLEYRRKNSNGIEWVDDHWRPVPIFNSEMVGLFAMLGQSYQGLALPVRIRLADLDLTHAWQLRNQFKEGDIVSLRVCADDFCDLDPKREPGRTKEIDIIIVGKREFLQDLDAEFEKHQREIANLQKQQDEALDLVKDVQAKKDADPQAQHDKLIAARQKQMTIKNIIGAKPDEGMRKNLADLKEKMKENKLPPSNLQDNINALTRELDRLARVDLPQIEDNLANAIRDISKPEAKPDSKPPDRTDPKSKEMKSKESKTKEKKDSLDQAKKFQENASKSLAELARFLNPWADKQHIKDRIIKLQAEQKSLKRDTETLLAKKTDKTSPSKEELDLRAERQELLTKQAAELLDDIKEIIVKQRGTWWHRRVNPPAANNDTAERLAEVAKIAEEIDSRTNEDLLAKMRSIGTLLRDTKEPKLNYSVQKQGEVIGKLDKMLAALDEKDKGEQIDKLVRNRKKVQREIDELQNKMDKLARKIDEARKIADPMERAEKLKALAPEQQKLREEAQKLSRELARLQAEKASRDLDRAAQDMANAEAKLQEGEDPGDAQPQAKEDLQQAKADLEQVQEELAREQQAQIATRLKGIKEREDAALVETERIHKALMAQKKWTGGLQDSLKRSGESQIAIAQTTEKLTKDLSQSPVVEHVLKKAKSSMDKAAEAIEERTQDRKDGLLDSEQIEAENKEQDKIVKLQKDAGNRLQELIDALKQDPPEKKTPPKKPKDQPKPPDKKDPEKEPQPKMRGGDGIPPAVEIKLLIAAQKEIREKRQEFDKRFPDRANLNEEQMDELNALIAEQTRLEELFIRTLQRNKGEEP